MVGQTQDLDPRPFAHKEIQLQGFQWPLAPAPLNPGHLSHPPLSLHTSRAELLSDDLNLLLPKLQDLLSTCPFLTPAAYAGSTKNAPLLTPSSDLYCHHTRVTTDVILP